MQITPHDVLLVIDVQRDFCPGGALAIADGDSVIEAIHTAAPLFEHILMTQDWHPPNHQSFASAHPGKAAFDTVELPYGTQTLWPDHCVQGDRGADFHPALHLPQAELVIRKGFRQEIDSYSAFFENDHATATGLVGYLRDRNFERVFLAGLAYDFCVGYSALDARKEGFSAVVLKDATRAIDTNGSVSRIEEQFHTAGVQISDTDRLQGIHAQTGIGRLRGNMKWDGDLNQSQLGHILE